MQLPKIIDRGATGLLWAAAGLTLAILLFILGFIIYRGFVSDNLMEYRVLNSEEESVELFRGEEELTLLVSPGVRISHLTVYDLKDIFSGKMKNWGNLSEQDLQVQPFTTSAVAALNDEFFGSKVNIKPRAGDIALALEEAEGGVALISAAEAEFLETRARVVPLWNLAVAVHPSVLEVKDNRKLRALNGKLIEEILHGGYSNWTGAGGIDLDLTWIAAPAGGAGAEWEEAHSGASPAEFIPSESLEDQLEKIASTPGAAGIVPYVSIDGGDLKVVKFQIQERKRNLRLSYLLEEPKRAGRVGGISSIIVNTIYMILLTIFVSAPIGVGAAIYLTEYAKQGRMVSLLRLGTETLAGIPSIIFGLFGFIVFVQILHLGIGLFSGTLTITLMILPTIIRTSEEAIKSVPKAVREGSLALGASKWQTIYKAVIPAALPGILTGVILGIGRAVGETAALLFTMGFDYRRAESLFTSARVLSVHLYQLVKEGISFDRAFATATILIFIVLATNLIINSRLVRRKY